MTVENAVSLITDNMITAAKIIKNLLTTKSFFGKTNAFLTNERQGMALRRFLYGFLKEPIWACEIGSFDFQYRLKRNAK